MYFIVLRMCCKCLPMTRNDVILTHIERKRPTNCLTLKTPVVVLLLCCVCVCVALCCRSLQAMESFEDNIRCTSSDDNSIEDVWINDDSNERQIVVNTTEHDLDDNQIVIEFIIIYLLFN